MEGGAEAKVKIACTRRLPARQRQRKVSVLRQQEKDKDMQSLSPVVSKLVVLTGDPTDSATGE